MAHNKSPTSSPLSVHRNSNTISKTKPKVRIIHIFAPEIIKTDASNFRELVQRLTGKPPPANDRSQNPRNTKRSRDARIVSSTKKIDMRPGFHEAGAGELMMMRESIKGEDEIWRGTNPGGGFLGSFDHDYFEEINVDDHQFPFMGGAIQIDDHVYEESQVA